MSRDARIREAAISNMGAQVCALEDRIELSQCLEQAFDVEAGAIDPLWDYAARLPVEIRNAYATHEGAKAAYGLMLVEAIGIAWQQAYERPQTAEEFALVWEAIADVFDVRDDLPVAERVEPLHASLFGARVIVE